MCDDETVTSGQPALRVCGLEDSSITKEVDRARGVS